MMNCSCCGKEIDQAQMLYCGLCGLCDTGACQNPKRFHELERQLKELEAEMRDRIIENMGEDR